MPPLLFFPKAPVAMLSLPESVLISVDLPTPDEPIKATIFPGEIYFKTASQSPSSDETASTSVFGAAFLASAVFSPTLGQSADFVKTATGSAPLSYAIER